MCLCVKCMKRTENKIIINRRRSWDARNKQIKMKYQETEEEEEERNRQIYSCSFHHLQFAFYFGWFLVSNVCRQLVCHILLLFKEHENKRRTENVNFIASTIESQLTNIIKLINQCFFPSLTKHESFELNYLLCFFFSSFLAWAAVN